MGSRILRLLVIGWLAVLLPGCEDPLEPEAGRAILETQAAPPRATGILTTTQSHLMRTQQVIGWPLTNPPTRSPL
jgi:hypothetical protein